VGLKNARIGMSRPVNLRDYERKKAESELWESKYIEASKENFVLKQEIQNLYKIVNVEVAKENARIYSALDSIKDMCDRVMPNSGWMYLGIINDIHAIAESVMKEKGAGDDRPD